MSRNSVTDSWIARLRPNPSASLRLLCFPWAGGGANVYWSLLEMLPAEIELCAIRLPGRENRMSEEPMIDAAAITDAICEALLDYDDKPYAFFGYSLGALIAISVVRELDRLGRSLPQHLFVSACRAPHTARPLSPIHRLPDAEFIAALRGYEGVPEAVIENQELMTLFLPALRADFTLAETILFDDCIPLDCGITAFGGTADPYVDGSNLFLWQKHTSQHFALRLYEGKHFFLNEEKQSIVETVTQTLFAMPVPV